MKRKVLALALAATMVASAFVGCGKSDSSNSSSSSKETTAFDYGSGEITIWVTDNIVDMTKARCEEYLASDEKYSGYTVTVEAVGEGSAASNVLTDVESAADIYGFAQDQLARLVAAGALQALPDSMQSWVSENNNATAKVGDKEYAFPMTSDNGYFLYYDKSVVTDPTSLEQIIADCEAAGKSFNYNLTSAWYNASFFFATGAQCEFVTNPDGEFTSATVNYASDEGLIAYKAMIKVIESKSYVDCSSVATATDIGAIVDGTWDAEAAKEALGDNYACAELPSFVGDDGNTYHLSSFSGYKLLGVKPQTEAGKAALCYELAMYLTNADAQQERFDELGWGPSNKEVAASDAVQEDAALTALAAQNAYAIPQGQYPDGWWDLAGALASDVAAGTVTSSSSDADLMAELQVHDDTCATYLAE